MFQFRDFSANPSIEASWASLHAKDWPRPQKKRIVPTKAQVPEFQTRPTSVGFVGNAHQVAKDGFVGNAQVAKEDPQRAAPPSLRVEPQPFRANPQSTIRQQQRSEPETFLDLTAAKPPTTPRNTNSFASEAQFDDFADLDGIDVDSMVAAHYNPRPPTSSHVRQLARLEWKKSFRFNHLRSSPQRQIISILVSMRDILQ